MALSGALGSNFLMGILFMKGEHRRAVTAIYRFCRAASFAILAAES